MKKWVWVYLLCVFVVMAGCMNAEDEELSDYVNKMKEDLEGESDVDPHITAFGDLIMDGKPEEALHVLQDDIIPGYEALIAEYEGITLEGEDAIATNEIIIGLYQVDLDTQRVLKELFTEISEKVPQDRVDEIDIDPKLERLYEINEAYVVLWQEYHDQLVYLAETYDYLEADENFGNVFADVDVTKLNHDNDILVVAFTEAVAAKHFAGENTENTEEDEEETAEVETESDDNVVQTDEETSHDHDQGDPHIVLDGTVTIEDNIFQVAGSSNLLEGSTINLSTYHYGSENPYLREELTVDADGTFELAVEVDAESLNGDPVRVDLAYKPEKEDQKAQEIYGLEGEQIEGPFKRQYTNIKRTRHGAFTTAQIEFKEGEEQVFHTVDWEEPADYGDLDIWMEKDAVTTNEEYYDITMKSNLLELTRIQATVEAPGYKLAGYTSRGAVGPDGSFRFQIPRPDLDGEEVIVIIEAMTDGAIATEEVYGTYGENFAGDLVENTKRGQKIVYELHIGE